MAGERQEYRLAVIGSWEAVAAFQALGADAFSVQAPETDAVEVWESLEEGRYAVVIMTEPVFLAIKGSEPGFPRSDGLPVVLVIPEVGGSRGVGAAEMGEVVLKAVGSVVG